jgi:uncharacterized membrane protein YkvA (DUF1232 family)
MKDRPRLTAALTALAAIIYGVSPIDVIPDVLAPFGLADDALVLVAAGYTIYRVLRRRAMTQRQGAPGGEQPRSRRHDAAADDEIIVERID